MRSRETPFAPSLYRVSTDTLIIEFHNLFISTATIIIHPFLLIVFQWGKRPIDSARSNGHFDIVDLLQNKT